MEKKESKKSTAMKKKRRPKIEEPEEIQPATIIEEIPVLLIEVRELAGEIFERLNRISVVKGEDIPLLAVSMTDLAVLRDTLDSCIQVIKAEGLKQMGLDLEDQDILFEALTIYGRANEDGPDWEKKKERVFRMRRCLLQKIGEIESKPELTATVNKFPESGFKSIIDRNMKAAAELEATETAWAFPNLEAYNGFRKAAGLEEMSEADLDPSIDPNQTFIVMKGGEIHQSSGVIPEG
jgi:hypothetical protein